MLLGAASKLCHVVLSFAVPRRQFCDTVSGPEIEARALAGGGVSPRRPMSHGQNSVQADFIGFTGDPDEETLYKES